MALVQRYENTLSTPGGNGATRATSGADRAYASMAEWETAEETDLPLAGDNHNLKVEGSIADTTPVIINGWETSAANDIVIESIDAPHGGKYNTSVFRFEVTGDCISNHEDFITLKGCQLKGTDRGWRDRRASDTGETTIQGCIVAGGQFHAIYFDLSLLTHIHDNIIYDAGIAGIFCGNGTYNVYNNTVVDCTGSYGIRGNVSAGNYNFINNVSDNALITTADMSGHALAVNNWNNNISRDASADDKGGTGNLINVTTLVYKDKPNDDFHLAATDAVAIGAGIGPASDSKVPLFDIDADLRSGTTTDIGADLYVAASVPVSRALPGVFSVDQTVNRSLSAPVAASTLVSEFKNTAFESLQNVSSAHSGIFSIGTSLVTVSRSVAAAFEALQSVVVTRSAPVAVLKGLSVTASGQYETVVSVLVVGPAALEVVKKTQANQPASFEALELVRAVSSTPFEFLGSNLVPSYEYLSMHLSDTVNLEAILTDNFNLH